MEVIIIGDLNCNLQGNCPDGRALFDFCSTLGQRTYQSHRKVTNSHWHSFNYEWEHCQFLWGEIINNQRPQSCLCLTLKFKAAKPRCSYITARSYKNYTHTKFIDDLVSAPFHIANIFYDLDDQVHVFKSRPNPYITPEIRQLMTTRDKWHKSAIKTKDRLHWNA